MSSDLIEHFELDARVKDDHTLQTEYVSDPARGLRKIKLEKKWYRENQIGDGAFGDVWLEAQRESNQVATRRAVKVIQKRRLESCQVDYKRELLALAKLSRFQELFVIFHGWYQDHDSVYLAMEYFPHGDLNVHIARGITEENARTICSQLIEGLSQMHDLGFTHRDLKPQNIFVVSPEPQWWVKIGDFGISKRVGFEQTALRTETGTRHFQAPEILGLTEESEETSEYTNAVDMWSLGCVVFVILTQEAPFVKPRALKEYCSGKARFPFDQLCNKGVSTNAICFIQTLLNPHPARRFNTISASQHPWLQSLPQQDSDSIQAVATAETATHTPSVRLPQKGSKIQADPSSISLSSLQRTLPVATEGTKGGIQAPSEKSPRSPARRTHIDNENDPYVSELKGHTEEIRCMTFSQDGTVIATWSYDQSVRIWDTFSGKQIQRLELSDSYVWQIVFSPNNSDIAVASEDRRVVVLHIATGREVRHMKYSTFGVLSVAFSPDGNTIVSGSKGKDVMLWDAVTGRHLRRLLTFDEYTRSVAFSADGKTLASASGVEIILWSVATGRQMQSIETNSRIIHHIALSSDGDVLASCDDENVIWLWHVITGEHVQLFRGHYDQIRNIAFRSDNTILSCSDDGSARLWNITSGKELQRWRFPFRRSKRVAMSSDGLRLASVHDEKLVRVWSIGPY